MLNVMAKKKSNDEINDLAPTQKRPGKKPSAVPLSPVQFRCPVNIKAAMEQLAEENYRTTTAEMIVAFVRHLRDAGKLPLAGQPTPPPGS
jgi:hypothetical protein